MLISQTARQATMNALTALLNVGGAGKLVCYSGAQPATPDDAPAGTLLAECVLSNPAFANADLNGDAVGNAVNDDLTPAAAGNIGFVRAVDGNGAAVADLTAGVTASGADVEFNTLVVDLNIPVRVISMNWTKSA